MIDSIVSRRSVSSFKPDPIARESIEQLLEAAVMAPNHHLNQPWRFVVLTGSGLDQYGEMLAQRAARAAPDPSAPEAVARQDAERKRVHRAPVLIVVASQQSDHPRAMEIEDVTATAAAAEHVLLAAPALGLGAQWRTGDAAYDPDVKEFFGLQPTDHIVGFMWVGIPDEVKDAKPRERPDTRTTWRGW